MKGEKMDLTSIIQNIVTSGAAALGITYIVGGLIVNLNLTRRGLVEYQILKVKYLVVGIVFLLQSIGTFVFAALPAFGLLLWAGNIYFLQFINILSMLAAVSMLFIWSRYAASVKSFVIGWKFWFIASAIGGIFPMLVLLRQVISPNTEWMWLILSLQAAMTAVLNFMAQLYHYSAFYYGRPRPNRVLDPIGVGIPTLVSLACDEKISADLRALELPMEKNILREVFLVDETDQHYIIALEELPGTSGDLTTYKIDKSFIRAILHKPYNFKKLIGSPEKKESA
jgi:hypothetical protein